MKPEDVRAALRRLGLRPSRRLGQHFLIDDRVAERIVGYAALTRSETALEIGPGLGILTRRLAREAGRVVAIERDRRMAAALREAATPNVEVLEGDALRLQWPAFDAIVANLPYGISSPLTFSLLQTDFDRGVLMYQREFAERLTARPGTPAYSRLTVGAYVRCTCRVLEVVPRSAFFPAPDVESAILSLRPHPPPFPIEEPEVFRATVDAIFTHRRKTIRAALRLERARFRAPQRDWNDRIEQVPFLDRRAEDLAPEEIARLAVALAKG